MTDLLVAYPRVPILPVSKTCRRCGLIKPIDNFRKRTRSRDGHQSWCKPCATTYRNELRKKRTIEKMDDNSV